MNLETLPRKNNEYFYKGKWYRPNLPVESTRKNKKLEVLAVRDGIAKLVCFGDSRYNDYTSHKSPTRKRGHLACAKQIKTKDGQAAKNNFFSANFWSINVLWNKPSVLESLLDMQKRGLI